jgi:hypothetical protein
MMRLLELELGGGKMTSVSIRLAMYDSFRNFGLKLAGKLHSADFKVGRTGVQQLGRQAAGDVQRKNRQPLM